MGHMQRRKDVRAWAGVLVVVLLVGLGTRAVDARGLVLPSSPEAPSPVEEDAVAPAEPSVEVSKTTGAVNPVAPKRLIIPEGVELVEERLRWTTDMERLPLPPYSASLATVPVVAPGSGVVWDQLMFHVGMGADVLLMFQRMQGKAEYGEPPTVEEAIEKVERFAQSTLHQPNRFEHAAFTARLLGGYVDQASTPERRQRLRELVLRFIDVALSEESTVKSVCAADFFPLAVEVALALGQKNRAINYAAEGVEYGVGGSLHLSLASMWWDLGRHDVAIKYAVRVLTRAPKHPSPPLIRLSQALVGWLADLGRHAEAIQYAYQSPFEDFEPLYDIVMSEPKWLLDAGIPADAVNQVAVMWEKVVRESKSNPFAAFETAMQLVMWGEKWGQSRRMGRVWFVAGSMVAAQPGKGDFIDVYLARARDMHPNNGLVLVHSANYWSTQRRFAKTVLYGEEALVHASGLGIRDSLGMRALLVYAYNNMCLWDKAVAMAAGVIADDVADLLTPPPYQVFSWPDVTVGRVRELTSRTCAITPVLPRWYTYRKPGNGKIRIGLLSSGFRHHPVGALALALLRNYDRAHMEVYVYSVLPDETSPMYAEHCDVMRDVSRMNDDVLAETIYNDAIQVLFWMDVYTLDGKQEMISQRPAPLIVNWLGYPGTTACDSADIILGDRYTIPPDLAHGYSERIAHMPHSYMPSAHATLYANDTPHIPDDPRTVRNGNHDVGLHNRTNEVIVANFNQLFKLDRETYHVMLRLLEDVPDATLWQLLNPEEAEPALREEASVVGVDNARLFFTVRSISVVTNEQHLERITASDVVIDTPRFNGHSTNVDLMWAGVPVVTLPSETFAGRVGASLLAAMEVPELIASSTEEQFAIALPLVQSREKRLALRRKILAKRETAPLFDQRRWATNFGRVLRMMLELKELGITHHIVTKDHRGD